MAKRFSGQRARLIYPETVQSEQIRELARDPLHLLVWYCLFHGLDDQGRLEARVSTILGGCMAHIPDGVIKPKTVQEALHRMRTITDENGIPLIYVYDGKGTKVLQVANWWRFQSGMEHAWPSAWPKPPSSEVPDWVDQIRGYGRRKLEQMVESGELDFDSLPEDMRANSAHSTGKQTGSKEEGGRKKKSPSSDATEKPWDVAAAFVEERGGQISGDMPGLKIMLNQAKLLLGDGFTVKEVREATKAFAADEFYGRTGFDLALIRAKWQGMKLAKGAKRASRPIRTVDDIAEPAPLSA